MERASIVRLDRFIQATRDSGYKGTASAVAELVDNSIQAEAKRISILIERGTPEHPVKLAVVDDGHGMPADVLRQALRFGGSTRFENRSGLGRYGMGLPNASLSQSRRVEVYTWTAKGQRPLFSYLDVDEIAAGDLRAVPRVRPRKLHPDFIRYSRARSGTVVVWDRADRLDNRRISTLERKLDIVLGRLFRHYIWGGVKIDINGKAVTPVDPLFVSKQSRTTGAEVVEEWSCKISRWQSLRHLLYSADC
jgi:hypothetical protein